MPSIESIDELLIHRGQTYTLVGGHGALLSPQCEFVRVLAAKSEDLNQKLAQGPGMLLGENVSLFCITKANRDDMIGFLFVWKGKKQILLEHGLTPWATCYEAKRGTDLERGGDQSFLITGSGETCVWRVVRAESDHLMRAKLTLRAVSPATGLPHLDFSRVKNPQLRIRIASDWAKLQEHLANKHGDEVVTSSKNILEGLFSDLLESAGQPVRGNLVDKLDRLEDLQKANRNSIPMGKLELHLAHKLRLLHQRTHPERAASLVRQVRPEFLLTCVEDLIEILAALGYVRDAP